MYVWMRVSADRYEFPEVYAYSAKELARLCGIKEGALWSMVRRFEKGELKRCRYVRVEIEEEE